MTESPRSDSAAATDAADDNAAAVADKRHILLIFAGLMVTMLLASLDQMIFSTALPTIVGELDGVNHMLWVTTAYILIALQIEYSLLSRGIEDDILQTCRELGIKITA